jgi:tetratricopeptide (TPR) repeat protein
MGEVYRARDTKLGRDVALKVLLAPPGASSDRRARFEREARLLATVNHSGIATIHDLLDDEGTPVLVMELVEGEALGKRLDHGALSLRQALDIGRQIAEALEAAHGKGIIHRDLKPSNVQLTPEGKAKLLDFGLAKVLEVAGASSDVATLATVPADLTRAHTMVGTVPYMSPEQLRGELLDQRSDIWSLGCVLYEMLTGKRPFSGGTRSDTIAAVLVYEPDWEALPRETPARIRDLLHRCLQKDRGSRLHHIADARIEMEEALVRLLPSREAPAARVADERSGIRTKWHRWRWSAAAVAAIAVLVAAGAGLWRWWRAPAPPAPGRVRVGVLLPQNASADAATAGWPELTQALFVSELTGIEGLAVVDPLRLNGIIQDALGPGPPRRGPSLYAILRGEALTFVIDGSITPARDGYRLQSNVVEPSTGDVRASREAVVASEERLADAVAGASQALLEFLEREGAPVVADRDLRPWLSRGTRSVEAMKAFMQYTTYALRNEPGGTSYLDRAIALDPTFVTPRIWRIPGLVGAGRIAQAREHYQALQQLAPRASAFDQAMIDWVGAYLAGDPAVEVRHLERALQYAPGNNILLVNLAESRLSNADLEGALTALDPALRMRWRFPGLYTLEGTILIRQGRLAEAKRALRQAADMSPVDAEVYGMLSALHRRDAEAAAADRYESLYARRSEELGWDAARQQDALGGCLMSVGLHEQAVRAFRQAVTLRPSDAGLQVHLEEALLKGGRLAEAAVAGARALELDPRSAPAHLALGQVRESQGKLQEALLHYETYLATGPRGPALREAQVRIEHLRRMQTSSPSGR